MSLATIVVQRILPPDVVLVHYVDDFLLVHHNKRYLRNQTGRMVEELLREGFIVSTKTVLDPAPSWFSLVNGLILWPVGSGHLT